VNLSALGDHEIWILLKEQDAEAWKLVWEKSVLAEARAFRNLQVVAKWGIKEEELMGQLYEVMIAQGKINLYRDDGGSIFGWMRTYVNGFIRKANPDKLRDVPIGAGALKDDGGEDSRGFEEKISVGVSESYSSNSFSTEDIFIERREEWERVQKCFGDLWLKNPIRAYVHLLKLRMNLSSSEIKSMFGISSEGNVDQIFSRAIKDMQELKVKYEKS
jgi:hypothetical protein